MTFKPYDQDRLYGRGIRGDELPTAREDSGGQKAVRGEDRKSHRL